MKKIITNNSTILDKWYKLDLNNKIEKICNNNKCTYINMYDNLTDKNGNMKRIYTVDGLHLNKIGYKVVASKLTKYLNE